MTRIHVLRTAARCHCGVDPRALPEGSRAVSVAVYSRAAERFAQGVVPGACMDCVEAERAERTAPAKKKRRSPKGP